MLGIKSEFILATMVMFTLEASPKVMFPPINASPATFNDPSKSTSSFNTIKLEAQRFVANHDYDAATGLMKAIAEFTGTLY